MKRILFDSEDEKQMQKNMNEIEIFKSLSHPNLIQYIESFSHKGKLCIIMEYADGGENKYNKRRSQFACKGTCKE